MALQCAVQLNSTAVNAGATPPVNFSILVYNPNAVAVTVTGVQVLAFPINQSGFSSQVANAPLVPIGPGQPTVVPALGSITIGPMAGVLPTSGANVNAFQGVPFPGQQWQNTNPAMPPQIVASIGALVYGSDGSINQAAPAGITASSYFTPPANSQGGYMQLGLGTNLATFLTMVGV